MAFTLGIGLEYVKSTKTILPYIKGSTGLKLEFSAGAVAEFEATIGPFSADVVLNVEVDNLGEPVVIKFGLDSKLNYYLDDQASSKSSTSTNQAATTTRTGSRRRLQTSDVTNKSITTPRDGFTNIPSVSVLKNAVAVSFAGGLRGSADAKLKGLPEQCSPGAFIQLFLSDINCILQKKPGCISVVYQANFGCDIPSFLEILLMDPKGIIDAVDTLLQSVEDLTIGTKGVITKFPTPIVGRKLQSSIGAGVSDNFLAQARRNVIGTLEDKLNSYVVHKDDSQTVADVVASALNEALGDKGISILQKGGITVTYFKHVEILDGQDEPTGNFEAVPYTSYDSSSPETKSLMWTFPFGQTINIPIPGLNFKLEGDALPLEFSISDNLSDNTPSLEIEWQFKLAFGFDEDDGFFLYTFPDDDQSEFFVKANAVILEDATISAKLLYFLE